MSNSTTWVRMDVHKENIVTVSISGDSRTVMTRWETPNTAKGKERLDTTAILDRVLHHAITINIKGESYRLKEKLKAGLLQRQEPKE